MRSAVKPSYWRCPHCCRIAGSQACVRQHVSMSADRDATVYSCRLCDFICTRLSAIRRHLTSHIQDVSDCDSSWARGTGEDNSVDTCDSGEIVCRSVFQCHCQSAYAWWVVLMMLQNMEWQNHAMIPQEMIGLWRRLFTLQPASTYTWHPRLVELLSYALTVTLRLQWNACSRVTWAAIMPRQAVIQAS